MNKKETEIKKNKMGENHLIDIVRIKDIVRFIADSSYKGRYTLERHTKSIYRFCFGSSSNVPMFEGKTANEAMYRAIDFELTKELKLASRDELTKLAENRLRLDTIQDEQQKRMDLEEKLAAKNIEYKKLMMERDELKKEMEAISIIVGRITDRWKDDAVMQSFEKNLSSWKRPSMLIAFLLENIEKLTRETASYVAPSLEDLKRMEGHPLMYGLAIVRNIRILESIWNDMLHKSLDGKWHVFSELDEIIKMHGNRGLTIESIRQKRGAYLCFAKDEKYHDERGGKDYIYEWQWIKGANKFRFTLVEPPELGKGKSVKTEKPVEKKDVLLEVEKRPLRTDEILAMVNKDVGIREPLWNDMQDSIMDGKWHDFSEANEIIMSHGYRQLTRERIWKIRQAYFKFARDDEHHTARGGKDYIFEGKRAKGMNKFRFTPVGEEVAPEKMVEKGLELGATIDCISDHAIRENPRDEFIRLFCDGKWHSFSETVEMLKKYENYSMYKKSSFPALKCAYMAHVQKSYQRIKKHDGKTHMFKFEKKRVKAKTVKLQNAEKCARCGQVIRPTEKTHQIDNLFYHHDCYEAML